MSFGFRAEAGYNSAKDTTFLRTNTPDFDTQLEVPLTRGSDEDKQLRALLEEQGIIDFSTLNKAVKFPETPYVEDPFGLVGGDTENAELSVENFPAVVMFGKEGSGVKNLIRSWLMSCAAEEMTIITFGVDKDIYVMSDYLDQTEASVYTGEDLTSSYQLLTVLNNFDTKFVLVGADVDPESEHLKSVFDFLNNHGRSDVRILIHNENMLADADDDYLGKDLSYKEVMVVGDVTEATTKLVGENVTARNRRGWLWVNLRDVGAVRVKSYLLPKSLTSDGDTESDKHVGSIDYAAIYLGLVS